MYVDVHTHLTHEKFSEDADQVIARAVAAGLQAIVVNGLNPLSNRQTLELADRYPQVWPALGIYPIDAVNPWVKDLPFSVCHFDVDREINFIAQMAEEGKIKAIGECGLDGYWVGEEMFAKQERVFERLIEIALTSNLPLIVHTRKREKRAMEILAYHKVEKVDFHCFGGKSKLAIQASEIYGWWFSIPCNARVNQSFAKLLAQLPEDRILTETDAPFLAPVRGERNEPKNVVDTIAFLAEIRGWSVEQSRDKVWRNFLSLFAHESS